MPGTEHGRSSAREQAGAVLYGPDRRPTAAYRAYLTHRRAYEARVRERDEAYARAARRPLSLQQWPITGRAYVEAVEEAADRWHAVGHRAEVEAALRVLDGPHPTS